MEKINHRHNIEDNRSPEESEGKPEIVPAFQSRVIRLLTLLFVVSIIFAFWLISYDEMIKAFIGILIINGWFFTILMFHLQGKILFLDDIEKMEDEEKQQGEMTRQQGAEEG
jgi:hypothetical protein